jgi:uncharacterized protein (DUF2336 family)
MDVSLLAELSKLSEENSSDRRRELLRSVTDLFLSNKGYAAPQLGMFEEIFTLVADKVAVEARAEFAERMADREDAPVAVVEKLATDDLSVAAPILRRSRVLSDEKLAAIAATSSQDHLLAISGRQTISNIITDVLVRRGDQKVVRSIAGNKGASFSSSGFGELARKAQDDKELQVRLVTRADLPPEAVEELLPHLSQTLMLKLADTGYVQDGKLPARLAQMLRDKLAEAVAQKDADAVALDEQIAAAKAGTLRLADFVQELALEDRMHALGVALASFAGLDAALVHTALANPSDEPIVLVARALDLPWVCFAAIVAARKRALKGAYVDDASLKAHYTQLSPRAAQRSLRFIKVSATVASDAA